MVLLHSRNLTRCLGRYCWLSQEKNDSFALVHAQVIQRLLIGVFGPSAVKWKDSNETSLLEDDTCTYVNRLRLAKDIASIVTAGAKGDVLSIE